MAVAKTEVKTHPLDWELAAILDSSAQGAQRERLEEHVAGCNECLAKLVSAEEAVDEFNKGKKGGNKMPKSINIYLVLTILAFLLSFAVPHYFVQFLAATLLLGMKWIVDSKSTKMLVMIYEAWKRGGQDEATKILEKLDSQNKSRF